MFLKATPTISLGLSRCPSGKRTQLSMQEMQETRVGFGLGLALGRFPHSRKWQPTPLFVPGKFHGQRILAVYSPWGHKGSDTIERLITLHICRKKKFKKRSTLSELYEIFQQKAWIGWFKTSIYSWQRLYYFKVWYLSKCVKRKITWQSIIIIQNMLEYKEICHFSWFCWESTQ